MNRSRPMLFTVAGVLIVESLVWCALLPWANRHYTTGIERAGLWKPIAFLAVLGAVIGLLVYALQSAMKVR